MCKNYKRSFFFLLLILKSGHEKEEASKYHLVLSGDLSGYHMCGTLCESCLTEPAETAFMLPGMKMKMMEQGRLVLLFVS